MAPAYANLPAFPPQVGIETTAHCNARCPFCPLHGPGADMDRPKGIMSMELFEKVVREVHAHRALVKTVFLNVEGEPLMDPRLLPRLALIRELKLGDLMNIQTNGQFLTEKNAVAILEAGINQLALGFDGATKEVYEVHRANCNYERVLGNARSFLRLRREMGAPTRVAIQYVRTHHNAHEVEQAHEMWKTMLDPDRDVFFNTTSRNWATHRIDQGGFVIETLATSGREYVPCPLIGDTLNVLFDGRVPVCCWDYNVEIVEGGVGNANTQTLAEIWTGPVYQSVRRKHARLDFSELPRCQQCTLIRRETAEPQPRARPEESKTRYGTIRKFPGLSLPTVRLPGACETA